jgi:flavin-binding protein dodecin
MRVMTNHVYKSLELTGSSAKSSDEAIRTAIARASKSMRNIKWFQVTETRGYVEGGEVAHWQVTIKVGFTLEDEPH